ncbi:MAG: 4-hydroxy-tetrahydrodipicolinate synthase [Clostridia bacterium]|nr:4-hydroxy-tetrahydrodipicolinate synthase [Clostridia bacterium]
MNKRLFQGSAAALPTPMRAGEIDFEAFERLIDRQIAAGTSALVVCGTTGEPASLTRREREWLAECALRRSGGRLPVIVGTGSNDTRAALALTAQACAAGADAALVVTPYYNKTTQAGLLAHFTALADASDIPLILYNVPSRTGVNLLPETVAKLARHPNVCGVKEASGSIAQVAALARLCGDSLAIYAGNDDMTLPVLALGGQGVISVAANVCPARMAELCARFFAGDAAAARAIQLRLHPLFEALFAEVNPIPVKAALSLLGLCRDELRLPLVPASPDTREALRGVLEEMGEK